MKSSMFGERQRYDFARCLADACPGDHSWNIYPMWVKCASISLRQAVNRLTTGAIDDDMEAEYMREIERVKTPKLFAEAMGILTNALEARAYDFLGHVLAEWGTLNKWAGQFFTPETVSRSMAMMQLRDVEPVDGHTLTLCEPACGGGSMLIAASDVLRDKGFCPWHYHWTATDIDWRMFATTYVQATLLGIPAGVIHGNTITLDQWDSARTLVSVLHPPKSRQGLSTAVPPPPTVNKSLEQLSLFSEAG